MDLLLLMNVICGCNMDARRETPVAPEMEPAAKKPNRQLTSCGGRSLLSTDVKYLVPPIWTAHNLLPYVLLRVPVVPVGAKARGNAVYQSTHLCRGLTLSPSSMMPPNLYSILPVAGEVVDRHPRHLIFDRITY